MTISADKLFVRMDRMSFVNVGDGRIYYEVEGMGRTLILIHGAWTSHTWWRWQIPVLSKDYRVLTIDVRGHGFSTPLESASSVEGFSHDLESVIEKTGSNEVALIGWSMGGLIAMQYCLDHPSRVKALILLATRGHRNPQMKRKIRIQYLRARLNFFTKIVAPRKYDMKTSQFPGDEDDIKNEIETMLSPSVSQEVSDWVMDDISKRPGQDFYEVARSIWGWGPGEELRKIRAPSLIMVGEDDRTTPPDFSHRLHALLPDSRLIIVEDAGHCLAIERPDVVNNEIIAFLKSVGY